MKIKINNKIKIILNKIDKIAIKTAKKNIDSL